jgi:hypothetical protein
VMAADGVAQYACMGAMTAGPIEPN